MKKHSDATLTRLQLLYRQRKAIKKSGVVVKSAPVKHPTLAEQANARASQISRLEKVLASPLPTTEAELNAEVIVLTLNDALETAVRADRAGLSRQVRDRYMLVVGRLTDMLIPDNGSSLEVHGIKRLALEVISAACNDARLPSKDADGRRARADARLFLSGRSPSQVQTRNAWLRTAGIEVDYYDRKFDLTTMGA